MAFAADFANLGDDGFADSGGVKIHYVTKGAGPLVVLIHGIPGFWYDWRHQIPALAQHFQVVAIDQRRMPDCGVHARREGRRRVPGGSGSRGASPAMQASD